MNTPSSTNISIVNKPRMPRKTVVPAGYKYKLTPMSQRKPKPRTSSRTALAVVRRTRGSKVVGRPIGTPSTKRYEAVNDYSTALTTSDEVLIRHIELTSLAQGTAINQRLRDVINLSGFELRFFMRNINTTQPLIINLAVYYPRNQNTPISNGFFRGYGVNREVDYPATVAAGNHMLLNQTPMNADDMDVLWRGQVSLGPMTDIGTSYFDRNTDSYHMMKKYIPVNRQIRYESTSAGATEDPLWLSIWACRPNKGTGDTGLTANYTCGVQAIGFFNEP